MEARFSNTGQTAFQQFPESLIEAYTGQKLV